MDIDLGKIDPLPFDKYQRGECPLGLSYSKVSTWLECRQRFFYEYVKLLTPKKRSRALQVGGLVHELLKYFYTGRLKLDEFENLDKVVQKFNQENTPEESLGVAIEAAQLVVDYLKKYQHEELEILDVEQQMFMPRIEARKGIPYILHSTPDMSCRFDGRKIWQLEHKTTARTDALYLRGLRNILQARIYHTLLNHWYDGEVVGVIYNLIVKTQVPKYERAPVLISQNSVNEVMETVDGVVREITEFDVWRNYQNCTKYNRECDYKLLCDKPEQFEMISTSFYERRDSNPIST